MLDKKNVAILFGGRSAEHDVSLQSACNVIRSLDPMLFEPTLIGIDHYGRWFLIELTNFDALTPAELEIHADLQQVTLVPNGRQPLLLNLATGKPLPTIDVLFPVLHGPHGEDGSVQGLARLTNLPCVGADILGSAMGMDKDVMKRLLSDAGIACAPSITLHHWQPIPDCDDVVARWGWPLFIKPANLGSSVGISKVTDATEFKTAIAHAFTFDQKIIIEKAIVGRELEIAVLGNDAPQASAVGEIVPKSGFYSYESKYIDSDSADLIIPAQLTAEQIARLQALAVSVFRVLDCHGLARVDMFLANDDTLYVNEINTLPGFTNISMFPKLWEYSGLGQTALITRLIELAIERDVQRTALKTLR